MHASRNLSLALFAIPTLLFAQITLEQEYQQVDGALRGPVVVQISENEHKYLVEDWANGTFSLYNLDHSVFLANVSAPVALYQAPSYYQVVLVSRSLFDCDSSTIEFAVARTEPSGSQFWIVRTDGTILFNEPGTLPYCVGCAVGMRIDRGLYNTEAGAKLMLMVYQGTPGEMLFKVFALCGELPHGINELPFYEEASLFPNPSDGMVTLVLPTTNPEARAHAELFNAQGQLVCSFHFQGQALSLDPLELGLANGTYSCRVSSGDRIFISRLVYTR